MKVKELIKALEQFDQDAMVVVSGYEGGYNYVDQFEEFKIKENVYTEWYYGQHDRTDDDDGVKVVQLS